MYIAAICENGNIKHKTRDEEAASVSVVCSLHVVFRTSEGYSVSYLKICSSAPIGVSNGGTKQSLKKRGGGVDVVCPVTVFKNKKMQASNFHARHLSINVDTRDDCT